MIPLLGMGLRPWLYLAAALALLAALGMAYARGRTDGHSAERIGWQQRELEAIQQRTLEQAALQDAIAARDAELQERDQRAADAVATVRVEYLPGKTILKREVSERVVFRDCRVGDGMRDTINAALRGNPLAGSPGNRGADGVPGGVADDGG